ncbi:phosphate transport system regulatory protein PhoU [Actinoplanes bogorensis]|uniref:Phosphate transport system regulatory protein PhoU n=1 Tax=Paractinoplanes bogorensis TaxID=1610840 RepID=A0ABS5YJT4_9ACTN|nr:PhoU domain-containing protein [Actinoplanes bogorensis]MBU2663667.1 phosphate transport system regulatory protein PhoU [Actinoplanes bogorensis]
MRGDFRDELTRVDSSLVTMALAVREAMRQASAALLGADAALAQVVIVRDTEIDVLHQVVEDRIYEIVGGRVPAPDDFRMIMTTLRAAADLQRMGGLSAHIARSVLRRHPTPAAAPELAVLFRSMSLVADDLSEKVVTALAEQDVAVAARLDSDDDAMDELHRQLFAVLVSPQWPLDVEAAVDGALLGRFYERYADHAVNIGHHVLFLATGDRP